MLSFKENLNKVSYMNGLLQSFHELDKFSMLKDVVADESNYFFKIIHAT